MSLPSTVMNPDCGSKAGCNSASAVDFPLPVGPTSATRSPGNAVKPRSATATTLAIVRKGYVREFDAAAHAARVHRTGPVAHRRHRIEHIEKIREFRRVEEQVIGEADRLLEPG